MSDIHFILTGGTIEKSYDPQTEKPEFRTGSIIPEYLQNIVKAYPQITIETVCQIDSLQMTDDIREKIYRSICNATSDRIIIIHGTSTMQDTAHYLDKNLCNNFKKIILTGAMIPMKEFAMSDGGFNLGYAMAKIDDVASGVYVCMNARCFRAGHVVKNLEIGRFEGN